MANIYEFKQPGSKEYTPDQAIRKFNPIELAKIMLFYQLEASKPKVVDIQDYKKRKYNEA